MQETRREEGMEQQGGNNKVANNIWKRELEGGEKASTRRKEEERNLWKREVEGEKLSTRRKEELEGEERLNMTVTGAEPSSPSREAARGDLNHDHCF